MAKINKALVLFSGGLDSTVCLFMARRYNPHGTYALTFDYEQRHSMEVTTAVSISELASVERETLFLSEFVFKSKSPLCTWEAIEKYDSLDEMPKGIDPTFVEGRNLLFMAIAFNRAAYLGCREIWIGVSKENSAGFPDCREDFIDKMEAAGNSELGRKVSEEGYIRIVAPLLDLSKAETIALAVEIHQGGEGPIMEAIAMSHTCYQGLKIPCGHCRACILRAKGFAEYGVDDPLIMRLKKEGDLPESYPNSGMVVK